MANMCSNWVEISPLEGGEEQVKELFALLGEKFDFDKIIPLDKDSSSEAREKWGCSTIANDPDYHEQCENQHEWYFWTKWNPPVPIYLALKRMFPLVFIYWRYEESGNDIYGYLNNGDY
jgi:hypothetical protein